MSRAFDTQTLAFYARDAAIYVDRPEALSPAIADFLELIPKGGRILELGCGGGREAKHMMDAGFHVDATDGVPEMAAQAELWLGSPVRVMRFGELDADRCYDAVLANASLLHVPLGELDDVLTRIWRALKPGGWHLASYKTGKPEGRDEFGRYYNQLSRHDAEARYGDAGTWRTMRYADSFEPGYFGKPSKWLTVVAQKAKRP